MNSANSKSEHNSNRILVVGNWKMNNTLNEAVALAENIKLSLHKNPEILKRAALAACPAYPHIGSVQQILEMSDISVGAQDCSTHSKGAHTGDISAPMISDLGCKIVILGHSERRQNHKEKSVSIAQKVQRAQAENLTTIICVGETLEERNSGKAFEVVKTQLNESIPDDINVENLVIAYEPVWAIGTGQTASVEDIKVMHGVIDSFLKEKLDNQPPIRILYGGSVKPENSSELSLISHVSGFLVGGASLNAESFIGIAQNIKGK